jgi:hypothetical protein
MAENTFKVIETQEQLDSVIKDRLSRAENKVREEFKGWTSPDALKELNSKHADEIKSLKEAHSKELEKYSGFEATVEEQKKQIHSLEVTNLKNRIVTEKNLPLSAVEFLSGETEEEISNSADRLSKLSQMSSHPIGFTRNTETPLQDAKDEALRKLAQDLVKN